MLTGQAKRRATRLPYLPGLDGLRAIAVIAVLLYHADLPPRGGFLGVDSFFVLSGFLITALLLAEWRQHGEISLTRFWLRRARRLLPALLFLLAGTLLYTAVALPWKMAAMRGDALAALAYVMNWHLLSTGQSYFDATVRPSLLQHLWSLAVEEQFYLLWPPVFTVALRFFRRAGLIVLALAGSTASLALMALLYQPGADPSRVYYGTDTHAAGLLLGAALALIQTPGRTTATTRTSGVVLDMTGLMGLAGLIAGYSAIVEQHRWLYPWGFALVALCSALVIVAATHPRAYLVPRLLGWQPLRWIGLRSYGLYLWHWPVFQLTRPYLDVPLDGWQLLGLRLMVVAAIVEVSYRLVELPVRHGALDRAARAWWTRVGPISDRPRATRLDQRWLLVPLAAIVLLAGDVWLTRSDEPHAVAPRSISLGGPAVPKATLAPAFPSEAPTSVVSQTPAAAIEAGSTAAGIRSNRAPVPLSVPTLTPAPATPTPSSGPSLAATVTPAPVLPTSTEAPTSAAPKPMDASLVAALQRVLDDTVSDGFVPGTVLSVTVPGYQPWSGASGVANLSRGQPMAADTLIHIASITKLYTAAVVLQLAEEGKIDLDAPIGTWLPDIVPLANRTTVRHLLGHRSGIFDYLEDSQFFVPAYKNPQRTYTPAELVDMVDDLGAAFEPGAGGAWKYSSTNYVILGMLVEKVSGHTLAQEMRRRIFDPLELRHTYFAPDEPVKGRLALGYIDESDRANVSMTFVFGTGNIVSTVDDLRRFIDALFAGRLLKPASLATMEQVVDTRGAYGMPELQYGLGLMRARLNVGPRPDGVRRPDEISTVLGHIGGIAGFRSAAWWVPQSGITIALSLNQADIDPNLLARDVLRAILTWQGR